MPDIPVGSQIFDVVFHPTASTVYTALLSGQVKAFRFAPDAHEEVFAARPSKRSCRALTLDDRGERLFAGGKAKAIFTIDTTTGAVSETRAAAHEDPINRLKHVMPWLLASGDDSGVIKLWDPRQPAALRTHKQHFDYISDFLWLPDKQHLLATSGDGTLSVMDVRSKKTTPFAHSEDQEDELLAATTIKGLVRLPFAWFRSLNCVFSGAKIVVGTQLGILSIFNRSKGYADCVDRVPGHPSSIDALCALPQEFIASSSSPGMENTVLTGSADGLVRAVQILPTQLIGVVADHGELPVERLAVGRGSGSGVVVEEDEAETKETRVGKGKGKRKAASDDSDEEADEAEASTGQWWVGSAGHDEVLRLTDLEAFFRNPGAIEAEEDGAEGDKSESDSDSDSNAAQEDDVDAAPTKEEPNPDSDSDSSDADAEALAAPRKRKRKQPTDVLEPATRRKKGRNEVDVQGSFFDEL
ncbi:Protein monoubiquitination-related protein [Mycena chlorophos]|uniref:WD repeat-containing protein JIP5 n=1 Tax=Mycena chlorophos TaxID=658473 RepID=A0A8H6TLS0_MYCCL|nr:Protein monoubiquitination-related protein [Mycena chlorophos]